VSTNKKRFRSTLQRPREPAPESSLAEPQNVDPNASPLISLKTLPNSPKPVIMNSSLSQQHIPARQANATPSANHSVGVMQKLSNPPKNATHPGYPRSESIKYQPNLASIRSSSMIQLFKSSDSPPNRHDSNDSSSGLPGLPLYGIQVAGPTQNSSFSGSTLPSRLGQIFAKGVVVRQH